MKIAYTYHGISQTVGGVSRYFYEISNRVEKQHDVTYVTRYCNNLYFKEKLKNKKPFFKKFNFKGKIPLYLRLQNRYTKKHFQNNTYDLIHHTGEDPSIFDYVHDTPIVVTVHDFIPEIFSFDKDRIERRRICFEKADILICVSNNTKSDLLKFLPQIDENKVHVIYHGKTTEHIPAETAHPKKGFLLYVGSRYEYKNFTQFVKSVAQFLITNNLTLRCTGESFNDAELDLISKLKLTDNIENMGFVDEKTLTNLYSNAICFVYPSLYEGFGIPILEAFSNNCPVCLSETSCFPEIAGDAANYFDPTSSDSILSAIQKLHYDSNYRSSLISKGQNRLKLFSWDQAAANTNLIYDELKRPWNASSKTGS